MHNQRFTFLCTKEERQCLDQIAANYRRSKGDTIRLLILLAAQKLKGGRGKNISRVSSNIRREDINGKPVT